MKKKFAILGGGNIGMSIMKGLLLSKNAPPENIWLTRRRGHLLESIAATGVHVGSDNLVATENANILIIAVKPAQIRELLIQIKDLLKPEKHIILSVVTGIGSLDIQLVIGNEIPIFLAMPNTAISLCESMTCLSTKNASEIQQKEMLEVFNAMGKGIMVTEDLMPAATVLAACGIAFALRFMRAASQGGIEIGFGAELSTLIAAQTLKGASELILTTDHHPEKEIDKVTTPQGITISGLNEMEHNGFSSALIKGLLTSYNKIAKINKNNNEDRDF